MKFQTRLTFRETTHPTLPQRDRTRFTRVYFDLIFAVLYRKTPARGVVWRGFDSYHLFRIRISHGHGLGRLGEVGDGEEYLLKCVWITAYPVPAT